MDRQHPKTRPYKSKTTQLRLPQVASRNEFLLVFDTCSGTKQMTYFMIDSTSSKKKTIVPKPYFKNMRKIRNIMGYRVVVMDNFLYITGGRHTQSRGVLNLCYRYSPNNNQWLSISNMLRARTRHTATVLDGYIYVCGGETRTGKFTDSVECYDCLTNSWTEIRCLPVPRADHAACACMGRLYVTGGVSDKSGANTNFWQYESITDYWTQAEDRSALPKSKERHSMLEYRGKIHVFGGITITKPHKTYIDIEDPSTLSFDCNHEALEPKIMGRWDRSAPDMMKVRCRAGVILIGHTIYHIGGRNYTEDKSELVVESYNIRRKRWSETFTLTGGDFSNVECCIINVPSTNKEFSTLGLALSKTWILW